MQWGGGMVDWEAQDYTDNGYYWAELKTITLECADDGLNTTHGYVYTGIDSANIPVSLSFDRSQTIVSFRSVSLSDAPSHKLRAHVAHRSVPPDLWTFVELGIGQQSGCRSFHKAAA